MTFEAYSVAIRLRLNDLVTPALGMIGQHMRVLNTDAAAAQRSVSELEKRLQGIKNLGLIGGAIAGVGAVSLGLFEAPIKAAREYELAFTKFKTLNLGEAVNKQADQFARSASLMGISAKELMGTMSESVGLFGSYEAARRLAPKVAALNQANSAIFGGKIEGIDEGASRSLLKFIDRRGGTHDDSSFLRNLDLAQKMVTGSGGFIKFKDLDQFSQQAGTAFRGLSDEGILNMALLLQEQGGSRAGTSYMSLYQNLISGRSTKAASHVVEQLGLGKLTEQSIGTVGGRQQTRSHLVLNPAFAAQLQTNPPAAIRDLVLPAIEKRFGSDELVVLRVINDMLSNRNSSSQASIMGTQQLQLLRDANLARNAMGAGQTIDLYQKDPNSKFGNLHARWTDVLVELGIKVLPVAIQGVELLNRALLKAHDFAREFPVFTKWVLMTGAALAATAAVGGTITLLIAGIKGLGLVLGGAAGIGLGASLSSVAVGLAAVASVAATIYAINEYNKVKTRQGVLLSADSVARLSDTGTFAALSSMDGDFRPRAALNTVAAAKPNIAVHVHNKLDRHGLTTAITREQARHASNPQTGINDFDGRMQLVPAGGN